MSTHTAQEPGFTPRYEEEPDWHLYEDAQTFASGFTPGKLEESEVHGFLDRMYDAVGPEWFEAFIASEYAEQDQEFYENAPEDDEVFRAQVKATMWNAMVDSPYFSVEPEGGEGVLAHQAAEGVDVGYEEAIRNMVEDEIIEQEFGGGVERASTASKYTKAGVATGGLVLMAGCAGAGLGTDDAVQDSPTPTVDSSTVDEDGDGLSLALERDLGTNDTVPNERMGEVYGFLEGNLTDTEKQFLRYVADNPHNIWPQIQEKAVYRDGDVTQDELRNMSDGDEDGLIRANELEAGTDPNMTDTDKDGLPDGWEWADGVVIDGNYVPLNGSDPLHKDIFLRIIEIDGNLSSQLGPAAPENATALTAEEAEQRLVDRYANANVTNPDGENGITLHISYEEDNPEKYEEKWVGNTGDVDDVRHPYWGAYYFSHLENIEREGSGGIAPSPGFNSQIEPDRDLPDDYEGVYKPHVILKHELMHNIVGELDADIRQEGSAGHPKQEYGGLSPNNVNVTSEISRDGILGLPRVSNPDKKVNPWNSTTWEMPDNSTRSD